jgi:[ribosomal protein S5]-alanine N-acetyltransferase
MAAELVAMARQEGASIVVAAQTLPERHASHRILEKLGFQHTETLDHPEDGTVWEWQLGERI